MIGQVFGRWTVSENPFVKGRHRYVKCVCVCGTEAVVGVDNLKAGRSASCGCSNSRLRRCNGCGKIERVQNSEKRNYCSKSCKIEKGIHARFWSQVSIGTPAECWPWTGYKSPAGYGYISARGTATPAHRVAYELSVGPIPEGLHIDHLCRNRACINPAHMEPVTSAENTRRGDLSCNGWKQREKKYCVNGHEFTAENTRTNKQRYGKQLHRVCRTCARERARRYYREKKTQ